MLIGKLITEDTMDVEYLVEGDGVNKSHYIHGIFVQAETLNKNGRKYPKHILEREVARYNNNYILKNRALGELGHPDSPTINLDRVSHMITELKQEGNNFKGKAKILNTPKGQIVQDLLKSGVTLGVSTRGVGSLKPANGFQLVGEDFFLSTIDIVSDPSAPEAFVQGIMEGKNWMLNEGAWSEFDREKAQRMLREASRKDFEEKAIKVFQDFISKL